MSATQHFTNKLLRLHDYSDREFLNFHERVWLYSIQEQIANLEHLVVKRREEEFARNKEEIDVGV